MLIITSLRNFDEQRRKKCSAVTVQIGMVISLIYFSPKSSVEPPSINNFASRGDLKNLSVVSIR